jgi:peptidoglycan-N-acetylglucosamine deacetylase
MIKIILLLLCLAFLFFAVYCLFPTLYYLFFKKKPFSFDENRKRIMISFDDGPDIRYTNSILDTLEQNKVHAAFFVVAEKAAENPEIIKRMLNNGHLVGLHSLEHRDAWRSSPSYQRIDFKAGQALLSGLGCKPSFYRAPWGHLTLKSLSTAKKYHMKILLWTVMVQDWEKESTATRVLKRLLKKTKNGSVICIHDSGCGKTAAEGAPAHTAEAVKAFVPLMLERGYEFVLPENTVMQHQ